MKNINRFKVIIMLVLLAQVPTSFAATLELDANCTHYTNFNTTAGQTLTKSGNSKKGTTAYIWINGTPRGFMIPSGVSSCNYQANGNTTFCFHNSINPNVGTQVSVTNDHLVSNACQAF